MALDEVTVIILDETTLKTISSIQIIKGQI